MRSSAPSKAHRGSRCATFSNSHPSAESYLMFHKKCPSFDPIAYDFSSPWSAPMGDFTRSSPRLLSDWWIPTLCNPVSSQIPPKESPSSSFAAAVAPLSLRPTEYLLERENNSSFVHPSTAFSPDSPALPRPPKPSTWTFRVPRTSDTAATAGKGTPLSPRIWSRHASGRLGIEFHRLPTLGAPVLLWS